MVGSLGPAHAGSPCRGSKHQHRQQEKDARDLKPKNTAHAAKGAQKAAHALHNAAACAHPGLAAGLHRRTNLRLGARRTPRLGRFCGASQPLRGNPARYAKPDAESPADGLRSHPVYDGSSDPRQPAWLRFAGIRRLRHGCVGSMVDKSCAESRAGSMRRPPLMEVTL